MEIDKTFCIWVLLKTWILKVKRDCHLFIPQKSRDERHVFSHKVSDIIKIGFV